MRACIHRGAREIGGSCVELEQDGQRIVLDIGRPLDAGLDDDLRLPPVAGLDGSDPALLGVVISHGHPDHYGLVGGVDPAVPVYIGEAAARILAEASFFAPGGVTLRPRGFLVDRQPLSLGPFRLTPYLADHSAFDAYGLLVEAGGRRLFYSGDFRAHGRRAALFKRLVAEPPAVDTLLLEGTRIGERGSDERGARSEREVEEQALEVFRRARGVVLALYSPQNVDRLVTLFRAAKRAERLFVLDLYAAAIVAATGRATIPQASWQDVRVFVPQSQRIRVKEAQQFERMAAIRASRIYPEQLGALADRLVLTFRGSMLRELERAGCLDEAEALCSMWPGYLDQPPGIALRARLAERGIPVTVAHASGHATAADLHRLAAAVSAQRVVPIHTAMPEQFEELFACAEPHPDGEWWAV